MLAGAPGFRGVGVGVRSLTDSLVFKVYVAAKRAASEVPAGELGPREIAGVPTDVLSIGRGRPLCWDKSRPEPAEQLVRGVVVAPPKRTGLART
jgi:hypothetical protein